MKGHDLITLGLSSKKESEVTAMKDEGSYLGWLVFISLYTVFFWYRFGDEIYWPIELARSGHSAEATVNSCRAVQGYRGREANSYWFSRCQITYDDHIGSIDHHLSPGQRISVLYLPYNPSVVLLGDRGDSWWTILVRNEGWFGSVFVVVYCLFMLVGLLIGLIGVLGEIFRKSRSYVLEANAGSQGQG